MEFFFFRRLTDTPIDLMDSISINTMTTCPSEGCRGKHGRVHLYEREKQQERPLGIPGEEIIMRHKWQEDIDP